MKGGTTILRLVITIPTRGLDGIFTGTGAILIKVLDGTIDRRRAATTIGIPKAAVSQDPELMRIDRITATTSTTRIVVIM